MTASDPLDLSYQGWTAPQSVPCFPGGPRPSEDTIVAAYINHRSALAVLRFGGNGYATALMSEIHTSPDGLRAIIAACEEALALGQTGGEAA